MPEREPIGARVYADAIRTSGKADLADAIADAVRWSGCSLLSISAHARAPLHVAVATPEARTLGAMVYAFRGTGSPIKGRAIEERRFQLRLGGEDRWGSQQVGFDPTGIEPTLMLGVHLDSEGEVDLFVAVDPALYDPLPSGISIEYKLADMDLAREAGWHVWERETKRGRQRDARFESRETLVAFTPDRFVDWMRFEAEARALGLDHGIRYGAALKAATPGIENLRHQLEDFYGLDAAEILDVISERFRLGVAVRGGVAERHLGKALRADPSLASIVAIDEDGEPDFGVELVDGRRERVECKVVGGEPYADGSARVEVQKTRSSRDDPASRFYRHDHFDVVAACVQPVTGEWEFRFKRTAEFDRHRDHPDRLAVMHRVDHTWSSSYPVA